MEETNAPFMSTVPLPYMLPSRISPLKGATVHSSGLEHSAVHVGTEHDTHQTVSCPGDHVADPIGKGLVVSQA